MKKKVQDVYGEILRLRNEFYQKWQEVPQYDENRDAYKAKYEAFDKALELLTPCIVDERPEPISPADVGFEALGKAWDKEAKKDSGELTHSEVTMISDQEPEEYKGILGEQLKYIDNEIENMKNLIERIKEKYGNNVVTLPEEYLILDDRGPMGSGGCANITKIRINDDKPEFYLDWWDYGWKSSDELIEGFPEIINEDKLRKILMSVCLEVDEFDSRLNQLLKDFSYLSQEDVTECLSFYLDVIKKKTQKKGISKLSFGSAIREYLNTIGVTESKFKVITLCGSTRFKKQFLEAQKRLTLEGCIVLSVGLFGHSGDEEVWQPGMKEMLDDMHLQKIDMSDGIYVINVGGYIGESTRREIAYAEKSGKIIKYFE